MTRLTSDSRRRFLKRSGFLALGFTIPLLDVHPRQVCHIPLRLTNTHGINSSRCTPGGISTTNFIQPALFLFSASPT